eukprot:scaffold697_cov320-Prasinococcus_capsulatus_cf.AAC.2
MSHTRREFCASGADRSTISAHASGGLQWRRGSSTYHFPEQPHKHLTIRREASAPATSVEPMTRRDSAAEAARPPKLKWRPYYVHSEGARRYLGAFIIPGVQLPYVASAAQVKHLQQQRSPRSHAERVPSRSGVSQGHTSTGRARGLHLLAYLYERPCRRYGARRRRRREVGVVGTAAGGGDRATQLH